MVVYYLGLFYQDFTLASDVSPMSAELIKVSRRSGQTSVPSSSRREALRLLQKKRESGGLPNGHIPPRQNGPLKADHTIQPIKQDRSSNYESPEVPDPYKLQGARPKRISSTNAIPAEYDIVAQELLQDTPIRSHRSSSNHDNGNHGNSRRQERSHRDEDRQRSKSRTDKNNDPRGLTRSPSKCSERSIRSNGSNRSVRFEDDNTTQNRQRNFKVQEPYIDSDEVFSQPVAPRRTSRSGSKSNQVQISRPSSRTSYENPYSDIELEYQERTHKKSSSRKKSVENFENSNGDLRQSFSDVDCVDQRSPSRTSRTIIENPYEELRTQSRSERRGEKSRNSPHSEVPGYSNPHVDRMLSAESPYAEVQMRSSSSRTPRSRDGGTPSPEHHPSVSRKPPSGKPSGRPRSMPEIPAQYSPPSPSDSTYARGQRSSRRRPTQPPPPPPPAANGTRSVSHDTESLSSNPCIINEYDDSISEIDEPPRMMTRGYISDLERYSEMSGSRTSLASRSSVTDKIQSFGKAAKKKFGSLRRAVSLDRIDRKSQPDFYDRPKMKKSPSLRSLSSILGRKKESDYDSFYQQERLKQDRRMQRPSSARSDRSISSRKSSSSVTSPNYLRKVGRILKSNVDGTQVIELVRPPSGPFGFYIARGNEKFGRGIFVSRMSDGYPEKMYAGLMGVGDEILAINGHSVQNKSMDGVYDLMADQDRLTLKILPLLARKDW
ncbi:uncharacterized protein LOC144441254 [Glandiceps talaboti]